ncbi:MAG: hypothetical protein HZC03_01425 [Candidatus Lloydbacteria bacterium]|nr:hypothetical protein [Candidatus Lloydbacteria bacterium]
MNKTLKIIFIAIVVVAVAIGVYWWQRGDALLVQPPSDTIQKPEEQKPDIVEVVKTFAGIVDQYQNFGKQVFFLDFEIVNHSARPANFAMGMSPVFQGDGKDSALLIDEPRVDRYVAIVRDNDFLTGQINEYEVDLGYRTIVSMRPIYEPNRPPFTQEEKKQIEDERKALQEVLLPGPNFTKEKQETALDSMVQDFLKKVEPEFDFIQKTFVATKGNKGGNYFYRWEDKDYVPPAGFAIDLPPFIQVGITFGGHIFSYDNTTSFFKNAQLPILPQSVLREICRTAEIPKGADDTSLDPQNQVVNVFWWDGVRQQNNQLQLPYEPETGFANCSDSAKVVLKHIQQTYESR